MEKEFNLNMAKISKELKLIMEILNSDNVENVQARIKESNNQIDWNLFLELAMHHRIYPLLANKLKDTDAPYNCC